MDPNLVITQFCDDYHSREDVIKALKTTVHQYIGKKRILLYLVASNIIKPTSDYRYFMNQLNTLKVRYTADVQTYLSDHFEPLEAIPDVSRRNVITGDIPRFKSRFYELMGHLNCSHIVSLIEQNSDSFDLSLHRIFALLSQRSNINYIQGHDRLCMGIMALAFHFYGIPKNLSKNPGQKRTSPCNWDKGGPTCLHVHYSCFPLCLCAHSSLRFLVTI